MNENRIELVDVFGNTTGWSTKLEVHQSGLLHRAFSIFIIRRDAMLIQKRAAHKYHSGGLWSNTCCSHPAGLARLEEEAGRRLIDEMDISCPLQEIFHFTYYHHFTDRLFEYEYDHVLLGVYEGPFIPNPEEASDARWISFTELACWMTQQPAEFTPWFLIAAPQVMEIAGSRH